MMMEPLLDRLKLPTRIFPLGAMIREVHECFLRGIRPLDEADASFRLYEDGRTVAQEVAHVGQMVDWFMEGAFGAGFDYDYIALEERLAEIESLSKAKALVDRAFDDAIDRMESASLKALFRRLPEGGMLSNEYAISVVGGIVDTTAQQRGVVSCAIRALGRAPGFPYKFHRTLPVRVASGVVVTG